MKKSNKKPASKKNTKTHLFCITLPKSLLESAKVYGRKAGFSSMSELLRAAIERTSALGIKKKVQEEKAQLSFRLTEEHYTGLFRTANQSSQSVARIIRALLENAPKLGIRPAGLPAPKKRCGTEKKIASAKKAAPKKVTASTKKAPSAKKAKRK